MIYGLGEIGIGMQRRRKEIRSERAAIRDEFERWRKNNPYATASEFHSKVKQLGATTPGGGVALPDHYAIQQMAAENQRQRQMVEDERARQARLQSLRQQEIESGMMAQAAVTGEESVNDLLTPYGIEVNEANTARAEAILRAQKATLAEQETKKKQREREMAIEGAFRMAGTPDAANMTWGQMVEFVSNSYGFETPSDVGQGPDGANVGQQAAPQPRAPQPDVMRVPEPVANPMAPVNSEGVAIIDAALSMQVPQLLKGEELTPQNVAIAIDVVRGSVLGDGYRSEAEFDAALASNPRIRQLQEQALDSQFNTMLEAPRDVEELVGYLKGQNVPLDTFLETAANLEGNLGNLYVPAGREAELADLLLGMLTVDREGNAQWDQKQFKNKTSSQINEAVKAELERYGFMAKGEIQANRQLAMSMGADVDTFEEVTQMFDDNMLVADDGTTAEQAIMAGEDMTERESRQRENIELLQYYKAVAMNGSSVDRYSLNMFDPADILSPEEQQRYAAGIEAYFNGRIAQLQALDLKKGTMSDDDIRNQSSDERNNQIDAQQSAAIQDAATTSMEQGATQGEREAMLSALRNQGYANQFDNLSIVRVEDGKTEGVNPFATGDLYSLLENDQGAVVAQAIKASLAAYESFELMAGNRGNVLSAVGGVVHNRMTEENQRVAAGLEAAKAVLKANGIENVDRYMNLITRQVLRGQGISGTPNRIVMAGALAQSAPRQDAPQFEAVLVK